MSTSYGTTSMHRLVANNQRFANQYNYDDLAVEPSARLAIVTCMDARRLRVRGRNGTSAGRHLTEASPSGAPSIGSQPGVETPPESNAK